MAIGTTSSKMPLYLGNNSTATFPFTFKIFAATDLRVILIDPLGDQTVLTNITDYTVTGVGHKNGGSVVLAAGNLEDDYQLLIKRVRPLTQTTSIRNQGEYFADVHEDTFDKIVMITQQLQEQLDRCIKLNQVTENGDFDPEMPGVLEANRMLMIGEDGLSLALGPTPEELSAAADNVADAQAARDAALAAQGASEAAQALAETAQAAAEAAQAAAEIAASNFVNSGPHSVTDGQSATALTGETVDGLTYSSCHYQAEIIRGTTVVALVEFSIFYKNGTWERVMGPTRYQTTPPGVTFTIDQTGTTAQLKAALNSGAGDGTIKFKKNLFPA